MIFPCQGLPSQIRVANVHKIRHRIYEIGYLADNFECGLISVSTDSVARGYVPTTVNLICPWSWSGLHTLYFNPGQDSWVPQLEFLQMRLRRA